jgi:hypothetical protein
MPTAMKIQIQAPNPPAPLLARLERQVLKYTDANYLYHCVWLDSENYCGVFGDGPNASYEWFIWRGSCGELETSNVGYGDSTVALRDVLNKVA